MQGCFWLTVLKLDFVVLIIIIIHNMFTAMKIHISSSTKEQLDQSESFLCVERGTTEIKVTLFNLYMMSSLFKENSRIAICCLGV